MSEITSGGRIVGKGETEPGVRLGIDDSADFACVFIPADRLKEVIADLWSIYVELGLDDAGRGRQATARDVENIIKIARQIQAGDLTIRAISEHEMPQGRYATIFLSERGKQAVVANIMLPVTTIAQPEIRDEQFVEAGPAAGVKFDG